MESEHQSLLDSSEKQIDISKEIEETVKQAINLVGNQSRYQVFSILFFSFAFFLVTYLLVGPSFFFMNPIFECQGKTVSEEEACLNLDRCSITNKYTITAQNGLYCGLKDTRNTIQAMFGVGAIIGVLFVNFFSDYQGRKFSLTVSLFSQILSVGFLFFGSHYNVPALFIVSQLLAGFTSNSLLAVSYVYITKVMSKIWADRTILVANGFGVLAELTLILFSSFSNWKVLALYVLFIPSIILFLFAIFFLIEDPIILYSRSRFQECKESLVKLSDWNSTRDNLFQALVMIQTLRQRKVQLSNSKKSLKEKAKYLKLILNKHLLITIFCLGLHQFGGNFAYFSLNYSLSEVGYSYGVSMAIFGIAEFAGIFPLMGCGHRIPRKKSLLFVVLLIIIFCFMFFLDLDSITQTILLGMIRFVSTNQYLLYIYLAVESFPQHIQSTSFGIVEVLGQISKAIAPLQISVSRELGISPIVAIGIVGTFFMLIPLFFVRETLQSQPLSLSEKSSSQSLTAK